MFDERIRELIDRHCELLAYRTVEIGKALALCNPYEGPVSPAALGRATAACEALCDRSETISLPEVEQAARRLDGALRELERRERIEPWDMVRVMSLQGRLAAAVDELEADRSGLYARCTTPEALAVAPFPEGAQDNR